MAAAGPAVAAFERATTASLAAVAIVVMTGPGLQIFNAYPRCTCRPAARRRCGPRASPPSPTGATPTPRVGR